MSFERLANLGTRYQLYYEFQIPNDRDHDPIGYGRAHRCYLAAHTSPRTRRPIAAGAGETFEEAAGRLADRLELLEHRLEVRPTPPEHPRHNELFEGGRDAS